MILAVDVVFSKVSNRASVRSSSAASWATSSAPSVRIVSWYTTRYMLSNGEVTRHAGSAADGAAAASTANARRTSPVIPSRFLTKFSRRSIFPRLLLKNAVKFSTFDWFTGMAVKSSVILPCTRVC